MEGFVKTDSKDVELYYCINNVKKPKANIIINHGFAEHLKRYDYVTKCLTQAGYNVLRYDLRGHGQSKGLKGNITSYENFISDADIMVDLLTSKNSNLKTYMLGHSLGGLITTIYGIRFPNKLQGQILSGAANGRLPITSGLKSKVLKIAARIIPNKHINNPVSSDICSVKEVVKAYQADSLVLKSANINFYNEFVNFAINDVLENLKDYKLPVLILHGEKDRIVPASVSKHFYQTISSSDKELKIYPDLYHEIFNENSKDEIIDKVINWLDKNLSKTVANF